MEKPQKVYLGDGCYAEFLGYEIKLTTSDGVSATNTIHLEPQMIRFLAKYLIELENKEKQNA